MESEQLTGKGTMKRRARHQAVQTEADWADEGFRLVGERMEIAAERTVFNADESIRQARLALEVRQAVGDLSDYAARVRRFEAEGCTTSDAQAIVDGEDMKSSESLPSSCDAWLSRPVGEIGGGE